ncbi:MAG: glycerophosphodiester phosphodiesterase [Clostridia bacterium]|nr:glycerophosphodiester phosphodiesterase [Clostridia bacterium]
MTVAAVIVGSILLLFIIYVMLIAGRIDNESVEPFMKARYAHRGLHREGVPENSLAAFKAAADKGYAIELDVHLMRDGRLAVIHDSSLKRTAGEDVKIESLTAADLDKYTLEGTKEKIPTLREVLDTVGGRVPLLIELKSEGNVKPLCSALNYEMNDYEGAYCVESFDPRCILWYKKNRPDVVRGQLSQNFIRKNENLSFPLRVILTLLILNVATQPDFIAFKFENRAFLSNRIAKGFWKMKSFVWTIQTPEDMKTAEDEGRAVIFENFEP